MARYNGKTTEFKGFGVPVQEICIVKGVDWTVINQSPRILTDFQLSPGCHKLLIPTKSVWKFVQMNNLDIPDNYDYVVEMYQVKMANTAPVILIVALKGFDINQCVSKNDTLTMHRAIIFFGSDFEISCYNQVLMNSFRRCNHNPDGTSQISRVGAMDISGKTFGSLILRNIDGEDVWVKDENYTPIDQPYWLDGVNKP